LKPALAGWLKWQSCKLKALSSNSSTTKKEEGEGAEERIVHDII
jgi:hypothetical protein